MAPENLSIIYGGSFEEQSWRAKADCRGADPNLFYPDNHESDKEAKEICRGCVVVDHCLEYALANGEQFGVWGGMSTPDRRRLIKSRALSHQAGQTATSA